MAKGKKKQSTVVSDKDLRTSEELMGAERGSVSRESSRIVVMDRRWQADRRSGQDRRTRQEPILVERRQLERRAKTPRRRQIDPTTCERDYTADEIEFMRALEEYKRSSGRMFPTCSEILEVLRNLGYEKRSSSATPAQAEGNNSPAPLGADSANPSGEQSPDLPRSG